MPFEPVRFLHAADVRIDHPVRIPGPLSRRIAELGQQATTQAFERLITTALERSVDFVLLAGNTFVEEDRSLSARLALLEGFHRLANEAIRVLIMPGPLDPLDAWRLIPGLPKNVIVFDVGQKSSHPLKRGDTLIARVGHWPHGFERRPPRNPARELRSQSQRARTFTVGLASLGSPDEQHALDVWSVGKDEEGKVDQVGNIPSAENPTMPAEIVAPPVDYIALGTDVSAEGRRTITRRRGVAHAPGATQGLSPFDSGRRGATIVDVDSDGTVRCEFVPTAVLRFERLSVSLANEVNVNDLADCCQRALADVRWETGEAAWILDWVVRGPQEAAAAIADPTFCDPLRWRLSERKVTPNAEMTFHAFRHERPTSPTTLDGVETVTDPIAADYFRTLAALRENWALVAGSRLAEARTVSPDWAVRIEALLPQIQGAAVDSAARRIGHLLFPAAASEIAP